MVARVYTTPVFASYWLNDQVNIFTVWPIVNSSSSHDCTLHENAASDCSAVVDWPSSLSTTRCQGSCHVIVDYVGQVNNLTWWYSGDCGCYYNYICAPRICDKLYKSASLIHFARAHVSGSTPVQLTRHTWRLVDMGRSWGEQASTQ